RTAQHLPLTELEVATLAFAVVNMFTWLLWWAKPLDIRDPIVVLVEVTPDEVTPPAEKRNWMTRFGGMMGISYNSKEYDPRSNNAVPTFWCTSEEDSDALDKTIAGWCLAILGECLIATIFGAIHFIGWTTIFPSIAEMWLWRLSAVLVTAIPIALPLLRVLDLFFELAIDSGMFLPLILSYIPVRLILLVLPFTALRALPPATFVDVNWSVYIPHL
ncbi:hypothetical protein C8F01DRAFT_989765, partial [Mycena amicta]